ncbi:methionyl-tRNA formyltransferase [Fibrobacterota bacterium]
MRIVFWTKGARGANCLREVLREKYHIHTLVLQHQPGKQWYEDILAIAEEHAIPVFETEEPNGETARTHLTSLGADVFVLAGYGLILKAETIAIPKLMCINLHGGALPRYRGSSPLNWVLIKGERSFGISIIKVDPGVDTGDVIVERSFSLSGHSTIADLHALANEHFPKMLVEALQAIASGTVTFRKQLEQDSAYYPLRFPEDGFILWDQLTAEEIHNRIRALTRPYPCAYTYFNRQRVDLISSSLRERDFYGEPGRIYLANKGKLLVCARDKCLWIDEAFFHEGGEPLYEAASRYEKLATVREMAEAYYTGERTGIEDRKV